MISWMAQPHSNALPDKTCDNTRHLTVDLGDVWDVTSLKYWYYYGDERTYCNTGFWVSEDGETYTKVYSCGTYEECGVVDSEGREVTLEAETPVRYVRWYSSRSNKNSGIHFTELEVYGYER